MIFKTFNSDKDTFSSQFGILGKSFEDIGNRFKKVSDELTTTNNYTISNIANAWKNSSIKKDLSDKFIITKSDIQDKLKNLSVYEQDPSNILENLQKVNDVSKVDSTAWQKYFDTLEDGEKWQEKFVQENDLTKVSIDDVDNAQKTAKQSAIAYNNGLKEMTIGAKAASVALKALSIAGNMIVMALISKGIEIAATAIDNYVHKAENATEAIENTMSAYESSQSDLESLNSELQTTQDKINDLESKDALTFTEQSELDNLKAQNNELERSIQLQEAKSQAKLQESITTATNDYKDSREEYFSKAGAQIQSYKDDIEAANRAIADAKTWENQDGVADYIADQEKIIEQSKSKIETYTTDALDYAKKVESMISTFEQKPKSEWSVDETATYNQMKSDLDQIYQDVLSKGEYTEWKIQPVFEKGKLKDAKDQILQYFSDGGTIDGLADKFGDDIMQAIRQACDKNGVAFSDVINSLYAEATDNLSADALKKKLGTSHNVNSAYEAKQYNQDKEVNNYIDSLSAKDRQILATIDFDEDVTVENLKKALSEAQDEADQETITSNINFTADTATAKSAMSSLTDALADYKENGLENMDISKLQALNNEDTFGNINGSTQDLEDFLSVMNDVNSTADQVQDAFDSLASAYLYSSQMAEQVTEETLGATQAQLEQMGVINAQEVAYQMLINKEGAENVAAQELIKTSVALGNAKYTAENASKALENASFSDTVAMVNEANSAGQTSSALINMAISKANIGTIQTDGDINNLIALCNQLGVATAELQAYAAAKAAAGAMYSTSGKYSYAKEQKLKGQRDTAITNAKVGLMAKTNAATKAQTTNSVGSTPGGGNNKSKTKSTKTEIDWLERAMTRVGKQIDSFKSKLENLFTVDTKKNNIAEQLKLVKKEMSIADKQVSMYEKKANKVKLSKKLKTAVRKGRVKGSLKSLIAKYGEKTANKIQTYQNWYDKSQEAKKTREELITTRRELQEQQYQLYVDDAQANIDKLNAQKDISAGYTAQNQKLDDQINYIKTSYEYQIKIAELTKDENKKAQLQAELTKELRDLEKEKFENIKDEYSSRISLIDAEADAIQSRMDQIETRGQIVGASYYESQIAYKNQDKTELQAELSSLQGQLALMEQAGDVGTKNWYDAKSAIADVQKQILDCGTSILNMNNSITEVANTIYDKVIAGMKKFSTEADFMVGLMDDLESFDELSHTITDIGFANLGSYFTGKESSAKQAETTKSIVEQMKTNLANGNYSYIDALGYKRIYQSKEQMQDAIDSFYENWRDQINQTKEYNSKIIDFMRNKLQEELAAVQDLIDAKKDALSAEKDLHDYQKSITESTKNIGTIQAQITALQGDSSESAQARIQALQSQLEDAQDDLAEKQYERQISDEQDMLDNMYNKYSDLITAESQDTKALIEKGQALMDKNMATIKTTMDNYATDYGYTYQQLQDIFSGNSFKSFESGLNAKLDEVKTAIGSINIPSVNGGSNGASDGSNGSANGANNESETIKSAGMFGDIIMNPDSLDPTKNPLNFTPGIVSDSITVKLKMTKKQVEDYIKKHASNPGKGKKKSDYGDLNKAIWDHTNGKVLSAKEEQNLAKKLGVSDKNYSKKSGALYKALKSLKIKGFSKGGLVSIDSIEKQVKENGDDGLISAQNGELVLKPYDSELFKSFMQSDLIQKPSFADNLVKANVPDFSKIGKNTGNNVTNGDITFEFNMPNVTDSKSMLHALQTDKTLQNAVQDLTIGQINRTSRLGINKYR